MLGLIFLKYISNSFQARYDELAAKQKKSFTDPEDRDEYAAANSFWVPVHSRWKNIQNNTKQATIGQTIDDAMTAGTEKALLIRISAVLRHGATHGELGFMYRNTEPPRLYNGGILVYGIGVLK